MLVIFAAALVAFILIILFLTWYYEHMSRLIFGRMNMALDTIISEGSPPEKWEAKLNKRLRGSAGNKKRQSVIEWYIRYVNAQINDLLAYANKTPFLADEGAKEDAIDSLERFRTDYLQRLRDMQ